jgi:hypothetical protein
METKRILGVMMILALGGCAADVAASETAPEMPGGAGAMAQAALPDGTDDYDPFAGDMPYLLVDAHTRVLDSEWLDLGTIHALWDYAQSEPNDARPWLLLARDSMAQEAHGFAVTQYRSAFEADARSADYAPMLPDVLSIALHHGGFEYRKSVELIVDAWGESALPTIDAAMLTMHSAGNLEGARKLAAIRAEVVGD